MRKYLGALLLVCSFCFCQHLQVAHGCTDVYFVYRDWLIEMLQLNRIVTVIPTVRDKFSKMRSIMIVISYRHALLYKAMHATRRPTLVNLGANRASSCAKSRADWPSRRH